ncbi:hypothetical protein BJ165DRAFT_1410376 [Panaeolus papilionaceus]|nr:hypothetical protein BJ165DRAFT_1410376 [Panaeolus papilionaceus]
MANVLHPDNSVAESIHKNVVSFTGDHFAQFDKHANDLINAKKEWNGKFMALQAKFDTYRHEKEEKEKELLARVERVEMLEQQQNRTGRRIQEIIQSKEETIKCLKDTVAKQAMVITELRKENHQFSQDREKLMRTCELWETQCKTNKHNLQLAEQDSCNARIYLDNLATQLKQAQDACQGSSDVMQQEADLEDESFISHADILSSRAKHLHSVGQSSRQKQEATTSEVEVQTNISATRGRKEGKEGVLFVGKSSVPNAGTPADRDVLAAERNDFMSVQEDNFLKSILRPLRRGPTTKRFIMASAFLLCLAVWLYVPLPELLRRKPQQQVKVYPPYSLGQGYVVAPLRRREFYY